MVQRLVTLFLFGSVFGTLGDFFHVFTHTDGYLNPIFPLPWTEQPFWVPILFGSATISIGISHPFMDQWIGPKRRRLKTWPKVIFANSCFLLLYAMSGFLTLPSGGSRDSVLALGAIAIWVSFDRTIQGIFLALNTALFGTLVELSLTQFGAFYYDPSVANFHGVPSWLPWLYVAASVSVGNLGRLLSQRNECVPRAPAIGVAGGRLG
jgi:hypothetical protein